MARRDSTSTTPPFICSTVLPCLLLLTEELILVPFPPPPCHPRPLRPFNCAGAVPARCPGVWCKAWIASGMRIVSPASTARKFLGWVPRIWARLANLSALNHVPNRRFVVSAMGCCRRRVYEPLSVATILCASSAKAAVTILAPPRNI